MDRNSNAGATPMVLTRRRGAHTAHTQIGRPTLRGCGASLHMRHPLERTHTNTHNDTYNCTHTPRVTHAIGAGQEQHGRLCIPLRYTLCIPLEISATTTAISHGGDGFSTPHHVVRFVVTYISGVGMVSIVSLLCIVTYRV